MRAAVYFAPRADHPLSRAAAAWLGRDAWTGAHLDRGPVSEFDAASLDALTAEPRRYGFHATLKPPFRLANGGLDELRTALATFCRNTPPAHVATLGLERIGPFFALTADGNTVAIHALADAVVRSFDQFRAPPMPDEVARRRPERLTPRQRAHLDAWGYPYVLDEFRFHLTLTGPVPDALASAWRRSSASASPNSSANPSPSIVYACSWSRTRPATSLSIPQRALLALAAGRLSCFANVSTSARPRARGDPVFFRQTSRMRKRIPAPRTAVRD